jgi:hypothetical protein
MLLNIIGRPFLIENYNVRRIGAISEAKRPECEANQRKKGEKRGKTVVFADFYSPGGPPTK